MIAITNTTFVTSPPSIAIPGTAFPAPEDVVAAAVEDVVELVAVTLRLALDNFSTPAVTMIAWFATLEPVKTRVGATRVMADGFAVAPIALP